jgi:AcrR family transcriptional regulator
MKNKKLSRREREKLRQRQEIFEIAFDLFSRRGYYQVSMHEIAEKAEFAIGTLYKFFQSKEDLYKALVLKNYDEYKDAITRAIEGPDDEVERLRNYIRTKGERFRQDFPFIRLFLAERRGTSFDIKGDLDDEMRKRHYATMEKLASVFEGGIKTKRFKRIADPFYLAVALDNTVDGFLLLWLNAPKRHPYPEDPNTILDIFCKGLIDP